MLRWLLTSFAAFLLCAATIETEVFDAVPAKMGKTKEEVLANMAQNHAMGRVAQPEEVSD